MSRRKALFASSLAVCTTSFAVTSGQSAIAESDDPLQRIGMSPGQTVENKQSLYQYLTPLKHNALSAKAQEGRQITVEPLTYQVKQGDNLYRIGLYHGVHYSLLAAFNQMRDPDMLSVGQKLKIPLVPKWTKAPGKLTVQQLAQKYGTTTNLLTNLNAFFGQQRMTKKGQWIVIPKRLDISPAVLEMAQQVRKQHKQMRQPTIGAAGIAQPKQQKVVKIADARPKQTTHAFRWPVEGQITSKFGWRHGRQHRGIDVWSAAKSRARIYAARGGVVTKAGYSGGYGNLVVIDHGNGYETYYAHLSRIGVSKGQYLNAGEIVGNMGQTGNATGYHLHFEIRKNGAALNPLSILP